MIVINYHNITTNDMLNGSGLRTVLWVAGCEHKCFNCQNPVTHDPDGGIPFDDDAWNELFGKLSEDHIEGVTFSGGDPLHPDNRDMITSLCHWISLIYPTKTIWMYTGYRYEKVKDLPVMCFVDVLIDGRFINALADVTYPWAGSRNQRVIDVPKTRRKGKVVLYVEC